MEVKLVQQLAYLDKVLFYGNFINLRKAYDAMDQERCLRILKDQGVGKNARRIIT